MENFNIENAKTRFFESKEHYIRFKAAWKAFHRVNDLSWREKVDVTPWDVRFEYPGTFPDEERIYAMQKRTALGPEHYLIYNLLRGYDARRGFSPLTNKGRIDAALNWGGYERPWAAHEDTIGYIIRAAENLQNVNSSSGMQRKWAREKFLDFTKPFGENFTQEMLRDLGRELHKHRGDRFPFPDFEVEEWRTEESFKAEAFREDLKKPNRTFLEKLKLWREA